MELKEALLKRRSIRKFTDELVSKEIIEELLHAGMSGPSACNRQPWEFFVVTNEELLVKMRRTSRFTNMEAKLGIVVCGNLDKALPDSMKDYWIHDCSAATQNILLRVTDLGLGAVWCGIYPQERAAERMREFLGLGENLVPLSLIWIGHPDESRTPRDWYNPECVHYFE